MNKARKVRLYPNEKQKKFFNNCFQFSIRAWNTCHDYHRKYEYQISPTCFIFNKEDKYRFSKTFSNYGKAITTNKNSYDKKLDSKIKNYVVKAYNQAWKKFFDGMKDGSIQKAKSKKLAKMYENNAAPHNIAFIKENFGKPRFHSFWRSKLSYTSDSKHITKDEFILPKIGKIKYRGKLLDEDVANFTVSLVNGKYYCSIIYKNVSIKQKIHTNKVLGMDWGEKTFWSLDNGIKLNPTINIKLENKINTLQQDLSRKIGYKNGEAKSHSYLKLKSKIDKLKEYRSNVLDEWEHQKTHKLVNDYDYIFIEDISYKNLHQISDKGVSKLKKLYYRAGMFTEKLSYKLGWYKEKLHKVNPKNTSKICSECGYIKESKISLNIRQWKCPQCGVLHDRDTNAAKNIAIRGLLELGLELGTNFIRGTDMQCP
ncbi:MAG: transposase [Methanobrevibacter sp.]|jgi:putative transposase|nr:transposase [Candidatus Methanovirga australis]